MPKRKLSSGEFRRICRPLDGIEIVKYGMPYMGALAFIDEEEDIQEMLNVAQFNPELHIASYDEICCAVNFYVEGKDFYRLCSGDPDPDIELCPEATELESCLRTDADRALANIEIEKMIAEMPSNLSDAVDNWTRDMLLKRAKKYGSD